MNKKLNRQQRRAGNKLLQKPEMKQQIDKFCSEFADVLINTWENAANTSKEQGENIDMQGLQAQIENVMKPKGEELAEKVKQMAMKINNPNAHLHEKIKVTMNSRQE